MDIARIHREQNEDHHPHACWDGMVFVTYTAYDETVGDEVERIEAIPCRRCAHAGDAR